MTTGTIARWVRKQKKESDADKAAGRPNRVQRAAQRVIEQQKEKERKREEKEKNKPKVVSGSVVASHPRKHLYGAGGILTKPHPPKVHTEIKPHTIHDVIPGGKHSANPTKPPKVKTEIGHHVVATNTRGASVFLKGATAPKN